MAIDRLSTDSQGSTPAQPDAGRGGPVVLRSRRADPNGHPPEGDDAGDAIRRAATRLAAATLAAHDGDTAEHSEDVVTLCSALADHFVIEGERRARLLSAAQLHDVGKAGVPPAILAKPGPLEAEELDFMREHTLVGERILSAVPELVEVADIVRHSHERWDGEGYPDGLAGEEIPLESRIVFCANAYHAIRNDRPYRRGRPAPEAMEELRRHAGTQFDPAVVAALAEVAEGLRRSPARRAAALTGSVSSRRLVALLVTLVVGGTALAAPGGPLDGVSGSGGSAEAASCSEPCLPGDLGPLGALPARAATAGAAAAEPRQAAAGRAAKARARARSRRVPAAGGVSGGAPASGRSRAAPSSGGGSGAGRGAGAAPVRPQGRALGRPDGPGRSEEAPGRNLTPGKSTGPGPGRSHAAPGKPDTLPGAFGKGQKR